ncbi:MAG: hypothetical protein PUB13_03835 [Lachnospiraceae bacterium]|nr:hypothetical protein [Lachnospiraceae bacterium]
MTQTYTALQWLFFFYLYSFIGWCYESAYVSIRKRRWVNRGFMRGPMLPLYGSGAVMMLVVSAPFQDSIILTYLAGCVGATLLEYVTGVTMEALFKVRYWDYSSRKFNLQGHICLEATLAWGLFTVIMTKLVHHPIETLVLSMPYLLVKIITIIITVLAVSDFTLSFKTALDLRDVLVKMEGLKDELDRLQKRLDVIIAFAEDSKEQVIQNTSQRADEMIESIEEKFRKVKEMIPKLEISEEKREEIAELRIKYRINKENRFQLSHMKDFYRKAMIKGNPTMVSVKFKESLEEIKKAAMESRKKK